MKQWLIVSLVLAIVGSSTAANAISGKDWQESYDLGEVGADATDTQKKVAFLAQTAAFFYVAGVLDDIKFNNKVAYYIRRESTPMGKCLDAMADKHITYDQIFNLVAAYTKSHPELWEEEMNVIVIGAIGEACGIRR